MTILELLGTVTLVFAGSWLLILRVLRSAAAQDRRLRLAQEEEGRRRRALEAVSRPLSVDWRMRQGYAKDGRDHR